MSKPTLVGYVAVPKQRWLDFVAACAAKGDEGCGRGLEDHSSFTDCPVIAKEYNEARANVPAGCVSVEMWTDDYAKGETA